MKVKVLKEGKNYGAKIAELILAGEDSHRQAAEFIKMGVVPMEEVVLAVKEIALPLFRKAANAGFRRYSLYGELADATRADDYTWADKLEWDIDAVTKEWRELQIPLNNVYDFWRGADADATHALDDYVDKVDKLLQDEDLRKAIPGFHQAWKGNPDYDEDDYGIIEHKQGNDMKQLLEVFKRNVLTEAAKNAQQLKDYTASLKDDEWLRGLWAKYGMWKLGKMLNIGIPDATQDNWARYNPTQQKNLISTYWQLMLKKLPPLPVVICRPSYAGLEVLYGAVFPKMGAPAELLKFDSGDRSSDIGGTMGKSGAIKGFPGGSITFHKAEPSDGECLDTFIVDSTYQTTKGWGPMLYDIAMEVATVLGGGLTSSRSMVSSHAKPVWDYYLSKRSDVEANQLDINKRQADNWGIKQLTPTEPQDDCRQGSAVKWVHGEDYGAWEKGDTKTVWSKVRNMSPEEREDVPWTNVSLSKVYKKEPQIIKFLGDSGLFHCTALGYDATKFHSKDLPPPPNASPDGGPPSFDDEHYPVSEGKIRIKIK